MQSILYLTNFNQIFPFYTSWKCQKTFGFLTSSEGIEMEQWVEKISQWI